MIRRRDFLAGLAGASLDAKDIPLPKLRSRVPRRATPTHNLLMIHSAQMANEFRLTVAGVEFLLGVVSGKVWHIETRDPAFATPEGIRVRQRIVDLLALPGTSFNQLPGCFAFVTLPSGWCAGFWPVGIGEKESERGKLFYSDMRSPADVPATVIASFVFKSIYTSRRR